MLKRLVWLQMVMNAAWPAQRRWLWDSKKREVFVGTAGNTPFFWVWNRCFLDVCASFFAPKNGFDTVRSNFCRLLDVQCQVTGIFSLCLWRVFFRHGVDAEDFRKVPCGTQFLQLVGFKVSTKVRGTKITLQMTYWKRSRANFGPIYPLTSKKKQEKNTLGGQRGEMPCCLGLTGPTNPGFGHHLLIIGKSSFFLGSVQYPCLITNSGRTWLYFFDLQGIFFELWKNSGRTTPWGQWDAPGLSSSRPRCQKRQGHVLPCPTSSHLTMVFSHQDVIAQKSQFYHIWSLTFITLEWFVGNLMTHAWGETRSWLRLWTRRRWCFLFSPWFLGAVTVISVFCQMVSFGTTPRPHQFLLASSFR